MTRERVHDAVDDSAPQADRPHLVLLTRRPELPSIDRLLEAARRAGLRATTLDDRECRLVIDPGCVSLVVRGQTLQPPDLVLPRLATGFGSTPLTVLRVLRDLGTWVINRPGPLACARNKLRTLQRLVASGLPVPRSRWPVRGDDPAAFLEEFGGPPMVVKALSGTQGMGVCLVESVSSARSVVDAFYAAGVPILLQEFVPPGGVDHRLFVVGGTVVAAMERRAPEGEFRANVHRGAGAVAYHPGAAERALAVRAAAAVGLDVAGVDLLPSSRGPLVLEVNGSPGLQGIEGATGVDVAGAICRWMAAGLAERAERSGGGAPRAALPLGRA